MALAGIKVTLGQKLDNGNYMAEANHETVNYQPSAANAAGPVVKSTIVIDQASAVTAQAAVVAAHVTSGKRLEQ